MNIDFYRLIALETIVYLIHSRAWHVILNISLFSCLYIATLVAGYQGINRGFGWIWAVVAVIAAMGFRLSLPLVVAAYIHAMNAWGWPLAMAALFATALDICVLVKNSTLGGNAEDWTLIDRKLPRLDKSTGAGPGCGGSGIAWYGASPSAQFATLSGKLGPSEFTSKLCNWGRSTKSMSSIGIAPSSASHCQAPWRRLSSGDRRSAPPQVPRALARARWVMLRKRFRRSILLGRPSQLRPH